jgi:hypothetical protein
VIPVDCQVYSGKIAVPKDGKVAAAQECVVLDRKTLVEWQGNADVKSLAIEWQDVSVDYYCDAPPKVAPACNGPDCKFDPSTIPAMTVDYCLCYRVIPTATDGSTTLADPRLIIKR